LTCDNRRADSTAGRLPDERRRKIHLKPFGVVRPGAAILVLSGALAAAVVWYPFAGIAVAASLSALAMARCAPGSVETLFLRLLVVVLVGYALLGRTFAWIGVQPVFVGEIVLAVGLLSIIAAGWRFRLVRTPAIYLLIVFMCWGAMRTIPYLGVYGWNAMRDAVIWGYAGFALLLAPLLVRRDLVDRIPQLYARLVPWILLIGPAWAIFCTVVDLKGTVITGAKASDAAPPLAGVAAFLLAGLARPRDSSHAASHLREWVLWVALLVGIVAVGSITRGGLVAIMAAMLIVMMLQPFKVAKKLLLAGATALLVTTVWLGSQSTFVVSDKGRAIHPAQIAENLMSIAGGGPENLEGTREWRLLWWNKIIDYTVHGPYFWTGKGFGLNLTFDDQIELDPQNPSRNPHNSHLTILARSGVPGMLIWAALQLCFAFIMGKGWLRARRVGQHRRAALFSWVMAYWVAVLLNASFDPYLETPQGGIWFWCVFAYGIALIVTQADATPAPRLVVASRNRTPVLTASGHP
jgi:hypothetical protein